MLNVYCTGHKWSVLVCKAFAAGAKVPIVPAAPLLPGDVFMYGSLRGLLPTLMQARREKRTVLYADNGYFLPGKSQESYFRITRNALQHNGEGELPFPKWLARERWQRLNLAIQPWRKNGRHVIVCPPARLFGAQFGFSADEWLESTVATLKKHTDRPIKVRAKMSWNDVKRAYRNPTPLSEDLNGAWALVTHCSNAAVESLLAGVPVFCTDRCGASAMALSDLSLIETPRMDEGRTRWATILANNQWTLPEMKSGLAWKMLNEIS